jgi:zinc and cadmium transporter
VLVQYSLVIAAASLLGGWMPGHVQFSHVRFQMLLSFVGGMLLGIGIFHLLPHAVNHLGVAQIESISIWMMAGIVMMFLLLRAFHVHHHEPEAVPEASAHSAGAVHASGHDHAAGHDHAGSCGHHAHVHAHIPTLPHGRLGWAGMFLGLGIHTLLDGLALGASMQADTIHGVEAWAGLGVLTGVVLHKPLDSLSITALMIAAGCSTRKRALVNVIYALLCPLGAAAFLMGISVAGGMVWQIVGCSLAFSAGIFLCIALADLLPEMEFHSHHRWWLSLCLMLGIGLAWGLRFLEPAHLHR